VPVLTSFFFLAFLGALGVLAVIVLLLGLGALAIAWFSTHPPRGPLRRSPSDFGAAYEDVEFPSRDGTPLSGWLIPAAEARGSLILSHGMSADRSEMLPWAEWLWKVGYTLLLFDFRALGRSGGDLCTMGLYEPEDVKGAVDYLEQRSEGPVGLLGFSMGGVAGIIAAAEDTRIRCVISHGAYADLDRAIAQRCRRHFGPLGPVVEWPARRIGIRWFPATSDAVSPLREIRRISPRPVLLLNGAHDPIVLPANAVDMHAAACETKELWILPHSRHGYPHAKDEAEYRQRVLTFLERALVSPEPLYGKCS
jgi:uncharacterized protein